MGGTEWENIILNEAGKPWSMILTLSVNFCLMMFIFIFIEMNVQKLVQKIKIKKNNPM